MVCALLVKLESVLSCCATNSKKNRNFNACCCLNDILRKILLQTPVYKLSRFSASSCVLPVDVPGSLMCDQFEVNQFQLHFSGVVFDILNGFQKLPMVVRYEIFEWDVDFSLGEPGFQVFLGWFSTVDMAELQEVVVESNGSNFDLNC